MKKTMVFLTMMLLMVSIVSAMPPTENLFAQKLKAERSSGGLTFYATIFDIKTATGGYAEVYCTHKNITYNVGNETYTLSNSANGKTRSISIRSVNTPCVKGDIAWMQIGDYQTKNVTIKKHHHHRVAPVVVDPVIPIKPPCHKDHKYLHTFDKKCVDDKPHHGGRR